MFVGVVDPDSIVRPGMTHGQLGFKWFSLDSMTRLQKRQLSSRFEEFARVFLSTPHPKGSHLVHQHSDAGQLMADKLEGEAIYFYRETEAHGHMSNFYVCNFTDGGTDFMCSEQFLMKKKLDFFDPDNMMLAVKIMDTRNPMAMQAVGREIKGYDEKVWSEHRFNVMVAGLRLKYSQNEEIRDDLLKTASRPLFEASHKDRIWGIGFSLEKIRKSDPPIPRSQYGQNLLGLALQLVRSELTAESRNRTLRDGQRVTPTV